MTGAQFQKFTVTIVFKIFGFADHGLFKYRQECYLKIYYTLFDQILNSFLDKITVTSILTIIYIFMNSFGYKGICFFKVLDRKCL